MCITIAAGDGGDGDELPTYLSVCVEDVFYLTGLDLWPGKASFIFNFDSFVFIFHEISPFLFRSFLFFWQILGVYLIDGFVLELAKRDLIIN